MKDTIDSLDDIPEILRSEYEPIEGGKFGLKLETGMRYVPRQTLMESNTKLVEFRENNRALNAAKTSLEQLKADLETRLHSYEGINPEEYKAMKQKITDLEQRGVRQGEDVTTLVAKAVEKAVKAAVDPLEMRLKTMADTEAATRAANERLQLERNLAEAGQKAGIDDRATQDYVNRGLQVWKIKDGKVVAIKDGEPLFSKQKPAEMMTMEEWALELQSEAPHLYKPSRGGGAAANGSGGNGGGGREHKKVISSDPLEFGRNLEGLARGDVIVQQ